MSAAQAATATFSQVFTDDPLVAQATRIKGVHITELRAAIDTFRSRVSLVPFTYTTDPTTTTQVTTVKAAHLNEMCTALKQVSQGGARSAAIAQGQTIKASDVAALRAAVGALE